MALVKAWLQRLIDRVFAFEEIGATEGCPYLHRWRLIAFGRERRIYLHRFVGSDWSRDPHDHPKRFISIGLWGSYIEMTPSLVNLALMMNGQQTDNVFSHMDWKVFNAPWIRRFPATHIHRIILPAGGTCWTLVFTGRETKPWGFFLPTGKWVEWKQYMRSGRPQEAKDC